MSTVHRILLIAFALSDRPFAGCRRAGDAVGAPRPSLGSEALTCAPWAGLYVEGLGDS
jgi:hypothetical protein